VRGPGHRASGPAAGLPSRRDLVQGALALGVAASVAPARAEPDEPRSGGTLRLGLGGGSTTDSLDPRAWDDSVMIGVGFGIFNGLVENGADNRPVPELASAFESDESAKVWTFSLRRGVHFHDGREFGADDAVYSLNLHRGAATSGAAGLMKSVTEVKKLGRSAVQVTLGSGNADFPVALTDYHIMMVPDGFSDWSKPVGTGAFTLDSFAPGVRIALKKAGPYWKPDRGHLDRIEFNVVNDTAQRMAALISGQVDAINRADPRTVSRVERSPNLEIIRAAGGWFPVMAMMVDRAPYTNIELRKALKYAVDREQVIKTLFSGYGTLGNDNPIPRSDPFFNTALEQLRYDPDRARFHFKRAGIDSPKIVLQTSEAAFNGAVDMATLLRTTAGRCDIPITVAKDPQDGYFSNVWLKAPFVASYWGGRPSATQMLEIAYQSKAPWNESHWNDPRFDKLLAQAQAEIDDAKRRQYIWDMQSMLTQEGGTLIPCFRDWLSAQNRRVGGHTPHSGFDMDNGRIAEKAWLRA
jgi:peptide/nickel transport system substrate-binding protein